jgi:hypothetical protein
VAPARPGVKRQPGEAVDAPRLTKDFYHVNISDHWTDCPVRPDLRMPTHRLKRTLAWLVGYRRLQVRYERRADILLGLVQLACVRIYLNALQQSKA